MTSVFAELEQYFFAATGAAAPDAEAWSESHPHHRRLLHLLRAELVDAAGPGDLAAALRAVLRDERLRSSRESAWIPRTWLDRLTGDVRDRHGLALGDGDPTRVKVRAREWLPDWLGNTENLEERLYDREVVAPDHGVPGDPVLRRIGFETYQTEAQREAVRTVLTAPPGATVVVELPTGSGKTACAVLPSVLPIPDDANIPGVTPIIVPTTSLAMDLQRRTAGLVDHPTAYRADDAESAEAIRTRVRSGNQGPVFVAPESAVGGLRSALLHAAKQGYIRYFVIDEAHIVASWGDEFRPAFQQLSALRREFLDSSPRPFVTVLLSATLTPHAVEALSELFAPRTGDVHAVHAMRLRPEPLYFWRRGSEWEKAAWIEEAIAYLPRPLILYTTKRADAARWYARLRALGYRRTGLMTGATGEGERDRLLEAWRTDRIDLMVATSAFGLGVDKREVRAVVHATLPESLDRFYQEVGRGGRDGRSSLSLMVWTEEDERIAKRLATPTFIGTERGLQRWEAMFTSERKEEFENGSIEVPIDVSPSTSAEDLDMQSEENQRWNVRTLLLMQRSAAITLQSFGVRAADSKPVARLVVQEDHHLDSDYWETAIEPRRARLLAAYRAEWDLQTRAVSERQCLAEVLQKAYEVEVPRIPVTRSCHSCPSCRARGGSNPPGRLRPRHSPRATFNVAQSPAGEGLEAMLGGSGYGWIAIPSEAACDLERLAQVVDWLITEGLRDVVLPGADWTAWSRQLHHAQLPPVFFHEEAPAGIRRGRPSVVLACADGRAASERIETLGKSFARGSVVLAPASLRQSDRPDRELRVVVTGTRVLDLDRWEEEYLA